MKNLYFLATVAAFVLGSCTVEEALDPPDDPEDEVKAIGFGTFLDRVPQNGIKPLVSVLDIDELKTRSAGFRVEAYTSGTTSWNDWNDGARTATPNLMIAQTVTWRAAGSSWTYSPIQYWPRSDSDWDKVSFFAYTPRTNRYTTVTFVPAGATNGDPQLHYTMPYSQLYHTDLIVDAEYNLTGDAGKVTFKFDHVLSRIGFKAKTSYAPATVTLSELRFYYGDSRISGTYTFNSSTVTGSNKDPGNWDVTGGQTTTSGSLPFIGSVEVTTTPSDIPGTTDYLMLIPQKNAAADQAYVTVSYTIDYPPGHDPVTEPVLNKKVYLPEIVWKPGIAYTYTLNIAAPKEMTFHVSEGVDWGPEEPVDIFHFHP